MKIFKALIAFQMTFLSQNSYAVDSEKVFEVFGKAYAVEQTKEGLRKLLDKNPKYVFSKDPKIGTKYINFISKSLAAYSLITAETDKEKGWAALQLVLPPDPTMILLAIQIADMLITIEHQRDLYRIYEETSRIEAERINILKRVYTADVVRQKAVLDRLTDLFAKTDSALADFEKSKFYTYFMSPIRKESEEPLVEEIAAGLRMLFLIREEILNIEVAKIFMDKTVDIKEVGIGEEMIRNLVNYCEYLSKKKEEIEKIAIELQSVLYPAMAEMKLKNLKERTFAYKRKLRTYRICVEAVNRAITAEMWSLEPDYESERLVQDCQLQILAPRLTQGLSIQNFNGADL